MRRRRRIAAYGLCRDANRVLLVRASKSSVHSGWWFLPGGGVEHGEHPADTVQREVREETGYLVATDGVRDVVTDVDRLLDVLALRHQDRIVYDAHILGGSLRDERDGSTDHAAWVAADALRGLPLMPFVARLLGVAEPAAAAPAGPMRRLANLIGAVREPRTVAAGGERRHQRFAAYGLVTDPAGRVLLTRIAEGYPAAGSWHLPGGGTDFGESASDGLLREMIEESGQRGRVTDLIGVSHRHQAEARGPEGVPMDWHGVRAVFRVQVDEPTQPRVLEAHGSTVAAGWFSPIDALRQPLTDIARDLIDHHLDR